MQMLKSMKNIFNTKHRKPELKEGLSVIGQYTQGKLSKTQSCTWLRFLDVRAEIYYSVEKRVKNHAQKNEMSRSMAFDDLYNRLNRLNSEEAEIYREYEYKMDIYRFIEKNARSRVPPCNIASSESLSKAISTLPKNEQKSALAYVNSVIEQLKVVEILKIKEENPDIDPDHLSDLVMYGKNRLYYEYSEVRGFIDKIDADAHIKKAIQYEKEGKIYDAVLHYSLSDKCVKNPNLIEYAQEISYKRCLRLAEENKDTKKEFEYYRQADLYYQAIYGVKDIEREYASSLISKLVSERRLEIQYTKEIKKVDEAREAMESFQSIYDASQDKKDLLSLYISKSIYHYELAIYHYNKDRFGDRSYYISNLGKYKEYKLKAKRLREKI